MTTPSPLRSRRFLIFGLAFAALHISFMFAEPSLLGSGPEPPTDPRDVIVLNGAAGTLAPILLGLPLGVLVDRARRRRSVLMVMALLGTVAVASVTVAEGLGTPGGPHVTAVIMATTALATVASVGQDAYLPSVVGVSAWSRRTPCCRCCRSSSFSRWCRRCPYWTGTSSRFWSSSA